jgi:hypothetical protein
MKGGAQALPPATTQMGADKEMEMEMVLAAVKQDGLALKWASTPMREERDVVLAAVKQNGLALCFASHPLLADKEVVRAAVAQDGHALNCASTPMRADKDVVLAAVKQNGLALNWASDALLADKDVVLAAAKQNGLALKYADGDLTFDVRVTLMTDSPFITNIKLSDSVQKLLEKLKVLAQERDYPVYENERYNLQMVLNNGESRTLDLATTLKRSGVFTNSTLLLTTKPE